jgi:hypothetical protein
MRSQSAKWWQRNFLMDQKRATVGFLVAMNSSP